MSKYSTGELAKLCDVSIRTVQFYDAKGLLPPTGRTEGGRRLYTESDMVQLRLICMLKAFGLTLRSVQGILGSETPGKALSLLLDEQAKRLDGEMKEKQEQIEAIQTIKEHIRNSDVIPVHLIHDIGKMMQNKKELQKVHGMMMGVGIAMAPFQIGSIILWVAGGIWVPFSIVYAASVPVCILLVRMYHRNTAYICAECSGAFRPGIWRFVFSAHTPKTRKLRCAHCGHTGYCIETYAKEIP